MARIALALLLLLAAAPAAHADRWLRPVDGTVLREFAVGRDPYRPGQHRGVDLAAARGSPVRSACAGRVSFAGRVPHGGATVSVRCGALVATYQQLGTIAVRAGTRVRRGGQLGSVGSSSDPRQPRTHLHLGAREAASGRYLDPIGLLAHGPTATPVLPGTPRSPRGPAFGPAPVSPRTAPLRPAPLVRLRPAPAAPPRAAPRGLEPGLPWSVWVGLACVGIGLPLGGFVRLRRRRRATSRVVQTA